MSKKIASGAPLLSDEKYDKLRIVKQSLEATKSLDDLLNIQYESLMTIKESLLAHLEFLKNEVKKMLDEYER